VLSFLFGIAISTLINGYIYLRAIRPSLLSRRWRIGLVTLMAVMFVAIPVTTWSRHAWPGLSATFGWVSLTWLALTGLTFVCLVIIDLGRLVIWLADRGRRRLQRLPALDTSLSRRTFLARVSGGTAVALSSTSVARGMVTARGEHEVVDVEYAFAKLPKALDGFSIVQLSDLHIGMTIDRDFVQRVVDRANALAPDLVVLTGDLIDGPVEALCEDAAPLAGLRARHGAFAITGNHEYYTGADPWIEELSRLGLRYLRNERVTIGDGAESFDLAGVDDHGASRYRGHGEDLERALARRDPSRLCVLLAHQPRQVRRASKYGVDLQLSGHTHGGQIWPWHYLVRLQQGGLLAGRYEHGGTQLYVTRGCGYWGPPVRVLAPLEITRIILRSA